jgi:hypothetical protein
MMKRAFFFFVGFLMVLNNSIIFAQDYDGLYDSFYLLNDDDDSPYLSDDDIAAMEVILPDDMPDILQENVPEIAVESENVGGNEISRINTSRTIYHLLILDRIYCSPNADIGDMDGMKVLYKYRHGTNGYIIALYTSPKDGPVFSQLPNRSRVLVDLITVSKSTIRGYINSSLFRKFVTNRRVLVQIQNALNNN